MVYLFGKRPLVKCPNTKQIVELNDSQPPKAYNLGGCLNTAYMVIYGLEDETLQAVNADQDVQDIAPALKRLRIGDDKLLKQKDVSKELEGSDISVTGKIVSEINPFEDLLKTISAKRLNQILDKFGVTKQTSIDRRSRQLRKIYKQNEDQQESILMQMKNQNIHIDNAEQVSMSENIEPCLEDIILDMPSPPLDLPTPPYTSKYCQESNVDKPTNNSKEEWKLFEKMLINMTGTELSVVLDKLKIKKQPAIKRRQDQLRKYFTDNKEQRHAILIDMLPSPPLNLPAHPNNQMTRTGSANNAKMPADKDDIYFDCVEDVGPSGDIDKNKTTDLNFRQDGDSSDDLELPSPAYVPINQFQDRNLRVEEADPVQVVEEDYLELPTPAYVPIRETHIPSTSETNINNTDSHAALGQPIRDLGLWTIVNLLEDCVSCHIFDNLIENTVNEHVRSLVSKVAVKEQKNMVRQKNNLKSYFLENKDQQSLMLNFLHENSNRAEEDSNISHEDGSIVWNKSWDIQTWTRDQLLDYAFHYDIANNLDVSVACNYFDALIKDVSKPILNHLFSMYEIIGPTLTGMNRKISKLKTVFAKNKDHRFNILNYLNENRQVEIVVNNNQNDLHAENQKEIEAKRVTLKAIRRKRNEELLSSGKFLLMNEIGPNPIIEAGKEMHKEMRAIKWGECVVCKERWPGMKVGPKSKKCERCSGERLKANIPPTFSPENDMDPGVQPQCLKVLNSIEAAAISLICPQLSIYKLKGGASGLKGHSISFHQDVQGFVNSLPRRPEDLPVIVLKAPNQKVNLTANRLHILKAIEFLKINNPEYRNITLDMEALNSYPDNSSTPVENICTFDSNGREAAFDMINDNEAGLDDNTGIQDDYDLVETAAPTEVPTLPVANQIRDAILGRDRAPETALKWPHREKEPASEWEHGYFSMAFPHLFPYGQADITKPRKGKNPEFLAYIRHLTRQPDNRFAADPRFLLHVINMHRRHKALTLGNVFASNVYKNMTMAELKEKVAQNDTAVMKSLVMFSSQIPGTKGYFSQESKKAISLEKWVRIHSKGEEMLNVFLTFSLPDRHLEDLHRLLPGHEQYLGKIVVPKLSDIPPEADPDLYIDEKTDYLLRSKAINENGGLVDYYAQTRINMLIEKVLVGTLGMKDYILRSEYQSRKALHWHMAARIPGLSMEDMKKACKKYYFEVRLSTEEEQKMTKEEVDDWNQSLARDGVVMNHPDTDEFKEEVAESRRRMTEFVTEDLGISTCHPQTDPKLWPGPEGQNVQRPLTNVLRSDLLTIADLEEDYEMMVNRTMLHVCKFMYCLKKTMFDLRCRFGFPLTLKGFCAKLLEEEGQTTLNEIVRSEDFLQGAEFNYGKLELLRNHPRIVSHIPELLTSWRGNIEQKPIEDPKVLIKYILKYIMKPEEGSLAFTDVIKTMTENADDSTPTRKLFQRILLKSVGEHDISKNEAWRIVSGESYVSYSRPFRYLNLIGNRRVNVEACEDMERPVLSRNFCDIYWAKETDENYLNLVENFEAGQFDYPSHPKDISLYEFSTCFTAKWNVEKRLHVPKPTPCFHFVPIPANVDFRPAYCETTLLLHKPGANPQNLTEHHETAESALFDFVTNDDRCPKVIKEEFLASLKMTAAEAACIDENVEDLVPEAGTQSVQIEQDDWMIGLGDEIRVPNLNDPEPDVDDDDEDLEMEWDENADWSAERQALNLDNLQVDDCSNWIEHQKVAGELNEQLEDQIDIEALNSDQAKVYQEMIAVLQLDDLSCFKLIDVSGGAGTGKSFLIKSILQSAFDLCGHNNLVRIAAPTGCAASQFSGGLTLHKLLKIPADKGCGELDDLSGHSLADLQETFRTTKALIIDEKGMIGLGRLSQINARLKQARPEGAELSFGGITILLAGDFRQLQPVGDHPLFSKSGGELIHQKGRALYKMFDTASYRLQVQMRQQGPENVKFRDQLERLANGQYSVEDWEDWSSQNLALMSPDSQQHFFETGTMLCAKKRDMLKFNMDHLKLTGNPIARLKAINSPGAASFDDNHAQGMTNKIFVAKGAKIVLTSNLWPEAKLVNGSQGTIHSIIYKEGRVKNLPDLILCIFPSYIGPSFLPDIEKVVPLTPKSVSWFSKNKQFSRIQYPLILSWALTIHKAQGKEILTYIKIKPNKYLQE